MRRSLLPFGLAGLAGLSVLSVSSAALAVAPPPCVPATITPRGASIPANIPGFAYTSTNGTESDVHPTSGGAPQAVTVTPAPGGYTKVVPVTPLVAGTTYRFDWETVCSYGIVPAPEPFTFVATAAAPLPTKLGAAPAPVSATTRDRGNTAFTISAQVALEAEMKPWLSAYQIQVVLDGKVVPTTVKANTDDTLQLQAEGWCDATLAQTSSHKVTVRGRLTFAPTVETEASELTMVCPATSVGPLPSDPPKAPDGTTSSSGGTSSSSSSSSGSAPVAGKAGGCAAAPSAAGSSSFAGLALGAFALSVLARRRATAAARRR